MSAAAFIHINSIYNTMEYIFRKTILNIIKRQKMMKNSDLEVTTAKKQQLLMLRFFLFHRNVMIYFWDIQLFVFLNIRRISKSMTSWWLLIYERESTFLNICFGACLDRPWNLANWYKYNQGQYFWDRFWKIWKTGAKF